MNIMIPMMNGHEQRNNSSVLTWLGSERGVVMEVAVALWTVGITSDWPWKLRLTIQLLGNQIWVNHWKLRVGIFTLRSSFSSTGSL